MGPGSRRVWHRTVGRSIALLLAVSAVASAWSGCGSSHDEALPGDGDAGPTGKPLATSGLPGNLPLEDGSAAQREQFCDYVIQRFNTPEYVRAICTLSEVPSATPEECDRRVDVCVQQRNIELSSGLVRDACAEDVRVLGCPAPVSEVEACLAELEAALMTAYTQIDCSWTLDQVSSLLISVEQPSCMDEVDCPAFFTSGGSDCCDPSDPCGYADDGYCDCPEQAWDESDCAGGFGQCCTPLDPCGYANDGYCDCVDQVWDESDCAGGFVGCCDPADPCGFANDGFCDCIDQGWDLGDCGGLSQCCDPTDPCGLANNTTCECVDQGWDATDCGSMSQCCDPTDPCGLANNTTCECVSQTWDVADCGGGSTRCCDPADPCGFANDGICDCVGQAWDTADCGTGPNRCCAPDDPCGFANDGICDCIGQVWDIADCGGGTNRCCDPADPCAFANDGSCDCPAQAWDSADCAAP